jgi:hypothetical protein
MVPAMLARKHRGTELGDAHSCTIFGSCVDSSRGVMPSNGMYIDGDSVVEDIALQLKYQYFSEGGFYKRASYSSNDAGGKVSLLMRLGLLLPSERC